jgi:hypothetical protein
MTETGPVNTLPRSSARIVSVLLYQGSPRAGASVPRGRGPTASAVAASGSESSLHSLAPQTFAELISVASKASLASKGSNSQATALGGTRRGSTAAAARSPTATSMGSLDPLVAMASLMVAGLL